MMSDWLTLQNALGLTVRPIDQWPGKPRSDREAGPFSAGLKDTLATLKRELAALSANQIVLQVAFRESDFRLDGLPRAGAIATHPGVILAFESKHGPLRLYFDRFTKWGNNLRAVAMHLEHLRLAGLYEVGTDGQQYKGWQALPEPEAFRDVSSAASFITRAAGVDHTRYAELVTDPGTVAYFYRLAAKNLHPDQGGSHDDFVNLTKAKEMLDDYHRDR